METLNAREMKKLSRGELLEMMLLQSKEIEKMQAEVAELRSRLDERSLAINKAGTLAEASILISNVLQEADNAAKDYLINIEKLSGDADRIAQSRIADARAKADAMLVEARGQAADITARARQEAGEILSRVTIERDKVKREADTYWSEISAKMEAFYQEHRGLREMLSAFGGTSDK